jgi:hypothetical protein
LEFWPKDWSTFGLGLEPFSSPVQGFCIWNLWSSQFGDPPQEGLAKFGKRWKRENRKFGIPLTKWVEIIVLEPISTYGGFRFFSPRDVAIWAQFSEKMPFCTSPNPHWWRVGTWDFFLAYFHPYS